MSTSERIWTESQLRAKTTLGVSLLVSAAAGSGKTAVLAERCAHLVCDAPDPCEVDELLVVTFTEAAAAEMRERIQAAIRARLESTSNPPQRMLRQLALVEHAAIGTLHGFCSRLIRQNFQLAGVDPRFEVLNSDEAVLLRADVVDDLMADRFERDSTSQFQQFVEAYGDEEKLSRQVTAAHELLCSLRRPRQWMSQSLRRIAESAAKPLRQSALGKQHLNKIAEYLAGLQTRCQAACKQLKSLGGFVPYSQRIREWEQIAADWAQTLEQHGYDRLVEQFNQFDPPDAPRVPTSLPHKDRAKQLLDSIRKQMRGGELGELLQFTESQWLAGQAAVEPAAGVFLDLVTEFGSRYKTAKAKLRSLDFSDLERKALELLAEGDGDDLLPSEVARNCHNQYRHVCVDEYQDINEIQDAILHLLSTECVAHEDDKTPNLFAVGDVKQSIYRFRLAEPQRFLDRMDRLRKPQSIGRVIDLQENFRSRAALLHAINGVFACLMTRDAAEIEYSDGHHLQPAPQPRFPDAGLPGAPIELHVLPKIRGFEEADEDDPDRTEFEATLCARRIKELIDCGTQVWENDALRPAHYGDFVLLLRSMKRKADVFAAVLRRHDIPVHYQGGSGFFDAREVRDCLALLSLLDNQQQDVPLAAVLRSPLARLAEPEALLARIRLAFPMPTPFHEAAVRYADQSPELKQLLLQLSQWRDSAAQRPLAELIWTIYQSTGLLAYVAGLEDGAQRVANLIDFHQRAREFGSFLTQGLHRFLRFLSRLEEETELGLASVSSGQEKVVRIQSIHRAKGQEFPIVLAPDLGKEFNLQDIHENILLDRRSGLGMKVIDTERLISYPSLGWTLTRASMRRQALAEEMRLLYVAMTRAKEHLILIGTTKPTAPQEWANDWTGHAAPLPGDLVRSAQSMLDWLGPAAMACGEKVLDLRPHEESEIRAWPDPRKQRKDSLSQDLMRFLPLANTPQTTNAEADLVMARLNFVYPHASYTQLPAATSPTAMKATPSTPSPATAGEGWGEGLQISKELSLPKFLSDEPKLLSAADIGTATHLLLEHLDFSRPCDSTDLENQLTDLVHRRMMTPSQAAAVDRAAINWFLETDLGKTLRRQSKNLRRELAFASALPTESADEADSVMLRGRIDLILPMDDGIAVVDHKTDRITAEGVNNRAAEYAAQIAAYRDALQRVAGQKVIGVYLVFLTPRIIWQ